jgi:hypothetical protein
MGISQIVPVKVILMHISSIRYRNILHSTAQRKKRKKKNRSYGPQITAVLTIAG